MRGFCQKITFCLASSSPVVVELIDVEEVTGGKETETKANGNNRS